jgi:hypothetical protein
MALFSGSALQHYVVLPVTAQDGCAMGSADLAVAEGDSGGSWPGGARAQAPGANGEGAEGCTDAGGVLKFDLGADELLDR